MARPANYLCNCFGHQRDAQNKCARCGVVSTPRRRWRDIAIGERFGRWVVCGERDGCLISCACECGLIKNVNLGALLDGKSTACVSCARRKEMPVRSMPEHKAWRGAVRRCTNPADRSWAHYGGRGITVCAEWQRDFEAFLTHIGPRPSKSHSLDRIDNDRGYEPGNVRWATPSEQARNKRAYEQWPSTRARAIATHEDGEP